MTDPHGRYVPRWFPAEAAAVAFPLGGIGTGNVSIGSRGQLRDWELFNSPGQGNQLPFSFFAIRAAPPDTEPVTRVLEARPRPPYDDCLGFPVQAGPGLPRLRESRLCGEYPFVWVDFVDPDLPVAVQLEAFTPLIPLNAKESGIPAAVLRYHVRNDTDAPVAVTVAGSLSNGVGIRNPAERFLESPDFAGQPGNEFRDDSVVRGLWCTSSLPARDLRQGTMCLVTPHAEVTAKPSWPPGWGLTEFWSELTGTGRLTLGADEPGPLQVGSLAVHRVLPPGRRASFEFVLAWHFPNRPNGWRGAEDIFHPNPGETRPAHNFYATWLPDAWHAARHVAEHLPRLERDTRAFHDALFGSTLPAAAIEAAAANIAVVRSTTCFRLADGTFASWEGGRDEVGVCPGSCTHVWNYAQTVAWLFPELERSLRRVEFGLETDAEGRMNFRANRLFGGPPLATLAKREDHRTLLALPAVDGQLGAIIRLYRDWRYSGDDEFLTELWPHAVRALEFALSYWDTDGDLVLDGVQHNTYDIEFHGPNSLANSLCYAALAAAAVMADRCGEPERARRYRESARTGARAMDALLWNGEYYVQQIRGPEVNQYGPGCLSDQVFGQLLAHLNGLGYVLPREHVRRALLSVYRNNFRADLAGHQHAQRAFALPGEGGLLLCTWPHGGRPRRALGYCDEVWTGIEYQVAAHLIYEGFVREGLTLVHTTRSRYDGYRRNPWNEIECGSHYVRSMASWSVLVALTGLGYDAIGRSIGFAPAVSVGERFQAFFSAGTGWGVYRQDARCVELSLSYGELVLAEVRLPAAGEVGAVAVNGAAVMAEAAGDANRCAIAFPEVGLVAGDVLRIEYRAHSAQG